MGLARGYVKCMEHCKTQELAAARCRAVSKYADKVEILLDV